MEVFAVMIEPYGFVESFGFEDSRLRLFVRKEHAEAYRKELTDEGVRRGSVETLPSALTRLSLHLVPGNSDFNHENQLRRHCPANRVLWWGCLREFLHGC